jgi:hypothetical protein
MSVPNVGDCSEVFDGRSVAGNVINAMGQTARATAKAKTEFIPSHGFQFRLLGTSQG